MSTPSASDLAQTIRATLRDEQWTAGERLGSERELAARYDVTRARLREALGILTERGEIRRLIGRAGGVFVADGRIERHLNASEGLPDITRVQGVRLDTTVLRLVRVRASHRDQRVLRLTPADGVYHLLRLREADGITLSLEDTRLPARRFPKLETRDLSQLGRVARDVYGMSSGHAEETLDVVTAGAEQARLLRVAESTPLMRLSRTSVDAEQVPIESAVELFVAGRMRFHLRPYGYAGNVHRDHG